MAAKNGGKIIFEKSRNSPDTLGLKNFDEITLSRTVSEIFVFYTKIQDGCQKVAGK